MKYTRKQLRQKRKNQNFQTDKRRLYSECKRKAGYVTTSAANRMIRHQHRKYGVKLNYYQCTYCGKFHLTKKWVGEKFKS